MIVDGIVAQSNVSRLYKFNHSRCLTFSSCERYGAKMPQAKKSGLSSKNSLDSFEEDWRLTADRRTDSAHLMGYGTRSSRDADMSSPAPFETSWIPDPVDATKQKQNQATSEPVPSTTQPPPKRSDTGSSTKSFSFPKKMMPWKSR